MTAPRTARPTPIPPGRLARGTTAASLVASDDLLGTVLATYRGADGEPHHPHAHRGTAMPHLRTEQPQASAGACATTPGTTWRNTGRPPEPNTPASPPPALPTPRQRPVNGPPHHIRVHLGRDATATITLRHAVCDALADPDL
ncbi:hypothetical protein GCM10025734_02600 [Kitasatospora paranensis]